MPAILIVRPASEPLSLAEAKHFLRVEHEADDALIAALIAAARNAVEIAARHALITQTWRFVLHCWPASGSILSPVNPLRRVIAARVRGEGDTSTAIDPAGFTLDAASAPAAIHFERAQVPEPGRALSGIEIDVEAGYGEAADVPPPLVQAIRLLVAQYYEHRDGVRIDALPDAVARLIAPFRVLSI
jgi:uncharacterized phiE125 gp8 family phage protein